MAKAIDVISAGTIFVAGGTVKNLAKAASLRFSASTGIVAGAVHVTSRAVAMGFSLTILVVLRSLDRFGLRGDEP